MTAIQAAHPAAIGEDLAGAIKTLRYEADRADRHAEHDKRHREWADRTARALAAVEQLARDAGVATTK